MDSRKGQAISSVLRENNDTKIFFFHVSVTSRQTWLEQRVWLGAVKDGPGPVWRWLTGGTVDRGLATSVGNQTYLALYDAGFKFYSNDGGLRLAFFCQHEHGMSATVWKYRLDSLNESMEYYIDGLAQDCSNPSALVMVLLQSCAKPTVWSWPLPGIGTKQYVFMTWIKIIRWQQHENDKGAMSPSRYPSRHNVIITPKRRRIYVFT